ncbi:MAG: 16S rRNA (guanine(527)-N(7))-methyltransferase RsmG [Bacteroidales bacterium]|nr:16S rRNA (guanine(527)-N(7))-methyltransferase RsmG [Bacteroidales bacterium]
MTYGQFIDFTKESFPGIGKEQEAQFAALDGLYRKWNEKINVISRKDIDGLYLHHVLHSLAIAQYIAAQLPETYSAFCTGDGQIEVLDLGTGGGFPGIPLAIMFPKVHFTLCDSVGKKTVVAGEVSKALGLENVTIVNGRAENLGKTFDYIVSRAVTSLDKFMPWVHGKYSRGIFYLKGGYMVEEIATVMGKYRMPKGSVHTWPVKSWLHDGYFAEKLVIFIENICN